jgi:hypothetical protein
MAKQKTLPTIEERNGAYVVVDGDKIIAGPFPDRLTAGLFACSDTKRHQEVWQERRRRALARQ